MDAQSLGHVARKQAEMQSAVSKMASFRDPQKAALWKAAASFSAPEYSALWRTLGAGALDSNLAGMSNAIRAYQDANWGRWSRDLATPLSQSAAVAGLLDSTKMAGIQDLLQAHYARLAPTFKPGIQEALRAYTERPGLTETARSLHTPWGGEMNRVAEERRQWTAQLVPRPRNEVNESVTRIGEMMAETRRREAEREAETIRREEAMLHEMSAMRAAVERAEAHQAAAEAHQAAAEERARAAEEREAESAERAARDALIMRGLTAFSILVAIGAVVAQLVS